MREYNKNKGRLSRSKRERLLQTASAGFSEGDEPAILRNVPVVRNGRTTRRTKVVAVDNRRRYNAGGGYIGQRLDDGYGDDRIWTKNRIKRSRARYLGKKTIAQGRNSG